MLNGLDDESCHICFVTAVTNEGMSSASLPGDAICSGLGGDGIDVGDRNRRSFAGAQQADRSPDTHRRVVLIVGLLTPAHDEQAAAAERAGRPAISQLVVASSRTYH